METILRYKYLNSGKNLKILMPDDESKKTFPANNTKQSPTFRSVSYDPFQ